MFSNVADREKGHRTSLTLRVEISEITQGIPVGVIAVMMALSMVAAAMHYFYYVNIYGVVNPQKGYP